MVVTETAEPTDTPIGRRVAELLVAPEPARRPVLPIMGASAFTVAALYYGQQLLVPLGLAALLAVGCGMTHQAWGPAELRFAEQIHEHEYGLRASLATFYRALRDRERVVGEELELLLRGEGPHGRSAALAGRLIRVLVELELVSLDRDLPALAIAGRAPTALERSPSFRVYTKRYEDGKRFLSSANHPPSG